ncbi:hypothetical protein H8A95_09120 [Bradyrhizobium sp. Pear76]|uniref:hypothetical protein n=1 Tax=Bradyrhizobium oropedii TaxID=1571201 RepID=UPI001E38E196|nr:hypothetical protein [Bradyrhizobium oropedii]MCC8962469.1 hypothetical protein [Bradyrhizobium oropedii]
MPELSSRIPASQSGRIRWVAERLYPGGRWCLHIAAALGIGRSTLYRYLERKRPVAGVDDRLMLLMARERIAAHTRGRKIAKAEKAFVQYMGRETATSTGIEDCQR